LSPLRRCRAHTAVLRLLRRLPDAALPTDHRMPTRTRSRTRAPAAPTLPAAAPSRPERWTLDAADAALATLHIPPDAARERCFEIGCAMTVRLPVDARDAWHRMSVQANGSQQWSRQIATSNPGSFDGLDYRFRRTVPVGESLRITVAVDCRGAQRRSLVIEADEA
jgi:hypothetical protein